MEQIEFLVIGAGVVGLAISKELAEAGKEVVLIDSATSFGNSTSSRNSEVIHAGIYYPPESAKAEHCIEGARLLYQYCSDRKVNHSRCGKLVVASNQQEISKLEAIKQNAELCGVPELELISQHDARSLEPELSCVAALYSPNTGIIDSHELMQALETDTLNAGGIISYQTSFISGVYNDTGYICELASRDSNRFKLSVKTVINCAGLDAVSISRNIDNIVASQIPRAAYSKGNYLSYALKSPFKHLIYPLPNELGLGIHATIDLANKLKFGPNTEQIIYDDYNHISMTLSKDLKPAFIEAISRYWNNHNLSNTLVEDYAGIRPKIAEHDGSIIKDFVVKKHSDNYIALYGIESPGLTSSLSIAKTLIKNRLEHNSISS